MGWCWFGMAVLLSSYKAVIPSLTKGEEYSQAIALFGATQQVVGVLGPGMAGGVAALLGTRQVFFLDGLTFLRAAVLLLGLPRQGTQVTNRRSPWQDLGTGTLCLLQDPWLRFGLAMQGAAAVAGASVLVNTVAYVRGTLHRGSMAG